MSAQLAKPGLAAAFRTRVADLHRTAERSGIVADLLHGRASQVGYALLLRNLLPVYQAMERGLERHRHHHALADLAPSGLYRAEAIAADLLALAGPRAASLPLLDEGARYVARVEAASLGAGARLIAHAYARYMGDLSGGQTMRRLLARTLDLPDSALTLYSFPDIGDVDQFKTEYRTAIDRAGELVAHPADVIEEAAVAFTFNIDLSIAVQTAAASEAGTTTAVC